MREIGPLDSMYFSVLNFEYRSVLVSGKDNEDLFWKLKTGDYFSPSALLLNGRN